MIPGEKRAVPAFNISCTQASTYSGDSIQHISIAGRDKWKNSSSLDKSGTLDLHGLTRAQRRVEVVRHKLEFFLHSSYLEGTYGYQGCLIQWPFFQLAIPAACQFPISFFSSSFSLSLSYAHKHSSTHNHLPICIQGMTTHSSILAWIIPWTEELGWL